MKRLLLVGGDRRALKLAQLLQKDGFAVETAGLKEGDTNDIHIHQADAVLFPYPFSVKAGYVPTLTDERIQPEAILSCMKKNALILSGAGLEGYVPQHSFQLMRYTDAMAFEMRNAELSAEAAVCEAMLHGRLALMDMNVLVTGYGLFGRALAVKMRRLGASVWIAARREQQRRQAEEDGMHSASFQELETLIPQMDMILNTVPAPVLNERHLKLIPRGCWLMEMASAPYGFDQEMAKSMGISCELLPGLPARYSPDSAAKILHDAVVELLGRGGK